MGNNYLHVYNLNQNIFESNHIPIWLVVYEDGNGKFRLETVKVGNNYSHVYNLNQNIFESKHIPIWQSFLFLL